MSDELQELVNRFLAWKLPTDFYPDCHIHFDREKAEKWGPQLWPSGTNLLNADQARAMLEHVIEPLRAQLAAQPRQPMDDGGLWSFLRNVMTQGAAIRANHDTYELFSARLDAAAHERVEQLRAIMGASRE